MAKNLVILIAGPKDGVGKTTFAANFALQYALLTKKQVVFLDGDRDCRNEASQYLNLPVSQTVDSLFQTVGKIKLDGLDETLFRGRIGFSEQELSLVTLGEMQEKACAIEPAHLLKVLAVFSPLYTFVIDMGSLPESFYVPLYDLADYIFWIMLPTISSLNNSIQSFDRLRELNFSMEKFSLILNQHDMAEGLSLRQINNNMQGFQKSIVESIPQEKTVLRLTNSKQMIVTEDPHSQYAKSIRSLTELLANKEKGEESVVEGRGNIWKDILSTLKETETEEGVQQAPEKTKEEMRKILKEQVHKQMIQELNNKKIDLNAAEGDPQKEASLYRTVEQTAQRILSTYSGTEFSRQEIQDILKEIMDDALGLGPLEELLRDKNITEIMVNKKDQIYIEHKGQLEVSDRVFNSDDHVVQVIRRIISPLGRRVDESVPLVDARLKDGSRVNAIISPLAVQGPMLTIRRFPEKVLQPEDLVKFESITQDMVDFLRACVIAEKNTIVSGGTGSGKTTLLNALSSFIPETERIITVEDVAELKLQQQHLGRLEARPPNIEGKGEITIRDLVRNTLRMRPDRIVVGECRGGEALDMLQAMNTGHDGSMTTIHANNPRDMIGRLEAMVLMAGSELPIRVILGYIASAVNIIVQIARLQDGSRKIIAISEVTGIDGENIGIQDIFLFKRTGIDENGRVVGSHGPTGIVPICFDEFKIRGVNLSVDIFKKKK